MSKIVKGVGKVFKKVVTSKIFKVALVATAAYFTFGIALSAIPATSAVAAGLPGFTGAAGAGTGIFSRMAGSLGLGGGLASGGGQATAATMFGGKGILGGTQLFGQGAAALPEATTQLASTNASGQIAGAAGAQSGATVTQAGIVGGGGAVAPVVAPAAAGSSISFGEKLLLAQMGTSAIAAFTAPTAEDKAAAESKFRGAFYGQTDTGEKAPFPSFAVNIPPALAPPAAPAKAGAVNLIAPPKTSTASLNPSGQTTPTQAIEDLFPEGRSIYNA